MVSQTVVSNVSPGGRPTIMATHGVVSSGHYLASEIGVQILQRGGNAMDAAAAVGFALAVLQPQQNGIGGEAPALVYDSRRQQVFAVSGNGIAPEGATIENYRRLGVELIPSDGFLPSLVPSALDTWILLTARFGTLTLEQVLGPALALAESGFPVYDSLHGAIEGHSSRFQDEWPSSARKFLPGGRVPEVGTTWCQPELAATFKKLLDTGTPCTDRVGGLIAARDRFYKGDIAECIARFCRSTRVRDAAGGEHCGLLCEQDMAAFEARVESPVATTYRGIDVYKCSTWTQGPVLLQTLNLLEGYDLAGLGHNSADYVHVVVEAMKLAFADREVYYGDPDFANVPLERLLSKDYADERRKLISPDAASLELRPGGKPGFTAAAIEDVNESVEQSGSSHTGDTTALEVIDGRGNMVSATPSGGWLQSSPVVAGLGFPLGTRGQIFSTVPSHPNALQPGKRPRTTLTPSLALRNGQPWMVFGSPGGDCQDQWALQFLLNVVEFGMSLQEAVAAPTFWTTHFPSSFYPRKAEPGALKLEGRIPECVQSDLRARGHVVDTTGDWSGGNAMAVSRAPENGVLAGGASPRFDPAYVAGW